MEFNTNKRKAVVAPGSVWETRMKNDQVKGGIKVFKQEEQNAVTSRVKRTSIAPKKTWTPVQKNSDEQQRSPIQSRKLRSDTQKVGETGQLKKIKSDPNPIKKNSTSTDSIQLSKSKSESDQVEECEVDDELNGGDGESEKIETQKEQENVENCEEKEISHENSVRVGNDEEIEIETEIFDVKEISIPEKDKVVVNEQVEPEQEPEKDKVVVNEPQQEKEPKPETKKVVNANMRFHHKNETRVTRPIAAPLVVKQSSTIRRSSTIYQNSSKNFSVSFFCFFIFIFRI